MNWFLQWYGPRHNTIIYCRCANNPNKTYLPGATWDNMFGVMCMPGGQWQTLEDGEWPPCSDPTTTTPAPTTTAPQRSEFEAML